MLPPIKIKLFDFKNQEKINLLPIKIKIVNKNITSITISSAVGNFVVGSSLVNGSNVKAHNDEVISSDIQPIKIKICDRDKNMSLYSEKKYAKVKESADSNMTIIKPVDEILLTDKVIEYLPNHYIAPIVIKIPDLDVSYAWLRDLCLKFNFSAIIKENFIVIQLVGRFVNRIKFKSNILDTYMFHWGKPIFTLKFKDVIQTALYIFKVDGLRHSFKFKNDLIGVTLVSSTATTKITFKTPPISETIIYDTYPRTIGDIVSVADNAQETLGQFTLTSSRLSEGNTIGDEVLNDKTIYDIMYKKVPRVE